MDDLFPPDDSLWELALDIWGDADQARAFFLRPHMSLHDELPIVVVRRDEAGRERIRLILSRLLGNPVEEF